MRKDPAAEIAFAAYLKKSFQPAQRLAWYHELFGGRGAWNELLRRVLFRSLCKRVGHALRLGPGVLIQHPERVEIGNQVFIGARTFIQARFDGRCRIGNNVWIGPNSYFDARDLILEDYVGWGPGAKVLGSQHTGKPRGLPIIRTDLVIRTVRVGRGADIGTNAILVPGVTIGPGAIVGAGAVVTKSVARQTVVVGVPARVLRRR